MGAPRSDKRLLVAFALGHLANDWAPSAIWLIAPAMAAAMGLGPAEVGLLITISSLGAALGYLPAGLLADRVSNRGRLLLLTFWWVAIGYALASFAPGFWTVVLLLAIAGLGDAAWHPIATGVLVQSAPTRRAQALGIHAMGGSFAEVLAPLAVGFLLASFDWRTTLLLSALPAALMGLAFLRVARHVPAAKEPAITGSDLRALWHLWRSRRGMAMIALISVYNMSLMAVLSMTPLFLQWTQGYAPSETGVVFAVMVLAGALAQPLIGRLSDTTGRKSVFIAGNLVGVLACLVIAAGAPEAAVIVALLVGVAALYGIRSAVLAAAVEFASRRETTTLGLAFVVLDGVGALGAALAGAVGNIDLHYAFVLAAVLAAGAAALALPIAFRTQVVEAAPAPGPAGLSD